MIVGALIGPTASGKSAWALNWAMQNGGGIISADSRQIYTGLTIGTAQPTQQELDAVEHHWVGFAGPNQRASAGDFVRYCQAFVRSAKPFLVVGGTGFYVKALIEGLADLPAIELDVVSKLEDLIESKGWQWLFDEMSQLDPLFVAQIEASDHYRLGRAWEVWLQSGQVYSSFLKAPKKGGLHDLKVLGLLPDRAVLHGRINARAQQMLDMGWAHEAADYALLHGEECVALRTVGYGDVLEMNRGRVTEIEALERVRAQTRQVAKRQITYMKHQFQNIVLQGDLEVRKDFFDFF